MYCGKCGKEVPDGYEYCMYCGTKVEPVIDSLDDKQAVKEKIKPIFSIHKPHHAIKIVVITFCSLLFILGITFGYIVPEFKYAAAKSLLSNGNYTDAKEDFKKLGNFQDSQDLAKECDYQQAKALLKNKDYIGASENIKGLGNYKDSADLSKEIQYDIAKEYYNNGKYTDAINMFSSLGDYKDSKKMKELSESNSTKKQEEDAQQLKQQQENSLKAGMLQALDTCPLIISRQRITYNSIGEALSSITAKNNSSKTIDAFTVYVYCYDNFNSRVNHYANGTNIFQGIDQDKIMPNGSINCSDYSWTMHGFDNTTKIEAVVKEIHYTDNTSWSLDDKYLDALQKFADKEVVDAKFNWN